jgi:hypothetical protein
VCGACGTELSIRQYLECQGELSALRIGVQSALRLLSLVFRDKVEANRLDWSLIRPKRSRF